ncbi:hypothetical protein Pan216_26050 [Planctomycetes bacterium Pan216]|uniref:Uncharacterized protein n=1 Tax=Kolteria novifilia TaxID=2527975 RepID=A0A518B486_9BACT|nr:hypothetical protein Pan216_26050 [Planctomycetes bacterium Pan216]
MSINIPRGQSDEVIERIVEALKDYEKKHKDAAVDIYRQNPFSIRVRIVDSGFAGMTKVERSNIVWEYLKSVTDDDVSDISTLLLLTPEEKETSFANFEFDDPVPSNL